MSSFRLDLVGVLALAACVSASADDRRQTTPAVQGAPSSSDFELVPLRDTPLALAGHTVTMRVDGTLVIDGKTHPLVPVDYKGRVTRTAHQLAGTTLTFVAEIELPSTRHDKPVWDLNGAIVAKIDLAANRIVWRNHLSNSTRERTWSLVATPARLYVRDRGGITAIDRATGADAWHVDNDFMRSILVPKIYDTMTLAGNTIRTTGHFWNGDDRHEFALELDAASGLRVYRTQRYTAPTPVRLYVQPSYRIEYASDRAPPETPAEWDGLRIGYAYLAWNKTTGEGIVVDPTKNDAGTIITIAKRQRYRDPATGKSLPIRWLAVYSTRVAIEHSVHEPKLAVLAKHKIKLAEDQRIVIEHEGELRDSGEAIDAGRVAAELGAKPIERGLEHALDTNAGPVVAYYDEYDYRRAGGGEEAKQSLFIEWGPYAFFDRYYAWGRSNPL